MIPIMPIIPNNDKIHIIDNEPIPFYQYLENNPHLYDHVSGLTDSEKAFLNEEFWSYKVRPATFSRHYLHNIDKYLDQYLELKAIQFSEKLSDLTTNERLLNIINSEASNLQRNGSVISESTVTKNETVGVDNNTKSANRALPMNSSGNSLDDIVDWSKGASAATEANTIGTNSVTGSDVIHGSDIQTLSDLGTRNANGTITDKEMGEQAVVCIERIWNYLTEPKALEWLCEKLSKCFILVF